MQDNRIGEFVRHNWLLLGVFGLAVLFALWFAVRFTMAFIYFSDPENRDVDLKGWMTPRYIVMTYDLPRPLVMELLGLDENTELRGQPLRDIAETMGLTMEELTALIREEAATYRKTQE